MSKTNGLFQDKQQVEFDNWCKQLNEINAKFSAFDKPLTEETGVDCWIDYFLDGYTPEEAYAEDNSYN